MLFKIILLNHIHKANDSFVLARCNCLLPGDLDTSTYLQCYSGVVNLNKLNYSCSLGHNKQILLFNTYNVLNQ